MAETAITVISGVRVIGKAECFRQFLRRCISLATLAGVTGAFGANAVHGGNCAINVCNMGFPRPSVHPLNCES